MAFVFGLMVRMMLLTMVVRTLMFTEDEAFLQLAEMVSSTPV